MLPPPDGGEWKDQEGDDYRVFNRYEKLVRQYAGRRSLADREYFYIRTVGDNRRLKLLPHIVLRG